MRDYVHGYSDRERQRLYDQAGSVRDLLHHDTCFPPNSLVLEPGCGVGAQTITLAPRHPTSRFVAIDHSRGSLIEAQTLLGDREINNVRCARADVYEPPFREATFDHVVVCHLLEHLHRPAGALTRFRDVLRPDGAVTVIEGDHGSCYFHPATPDALRAWHCLIEVQAHLGGDSLIGRRLYPLLREAGFRRIRVSPRMVYADESHPALMESFVERTIIPMVDGVRDRALAMGLADAETWRRGIDDLFRISRAPGGTFCYTFFKGTAIK